MKIKEIAELINGKFEGNAELEIKNIGKIEYAGSNEITFISNPKYEKYFESTSADAVIISNELVLKSEIITPFKSGVIPFSKKNIRTVSHIPTASSITTSDGSSPNLLIINFEAYIPATKQIRINAKSQKGS